MLLLPWDKYYMSRTFPKVWSTLVWIKSSQTKSTNLVQILLASDVIVNLHLENTYMLSHHTEFKVYSLQLGREKFLTWEKVMVTGARSAAQRISFLASCTILYNTVPSVLKLIAWRSETFHFLGFLNALIDREYPCCQSKWASCPRLGGDCRSSNYHKVPLPQNKFIELKKKKN